MLTFFSLSSLHKTLRTFVDVWVTSLSILLNLVSSQYIRIIQEDIILKTVKSIDIWIHEACASIHYLKYLLSWSQFCLLPLRWSFRGFQRQDGIEPDGNLSTYSSTEACVISGWVLEEDICSVWPVQMSCWDQSLVYCDMNVWFCWAWFGLLNPLCFGRWHTSSLVRGEGPSLTSTVLSIHLNVPSCSPWQKSAEDGSLTSTDWPGGTFTSS